MSRNWAPGQNMDNAYTLVVIHIIVISALKLKNIGENNVQNEIM